MDLKQFFAEVVRVLTKDKARFALAGGLVASLYRREERLTKDLDFLLLAEGGSEQKAAQVIRSFGLHPHLIRKAELEGGPLFAIKRRNTPVWMVAGRQGDAIGLDFILPGMPWCESALARAEQNSIDFGFGKVPSLTVEDLILAKLFALKNDSSRFSDLDDLQSIFLAKHPLNLAYLTGQMQRLDLTVPTLLRETIPSALRLVMRKRKGR